jgi:hypothetical protein
MKETWFVEPGETIELKLKFSDHTGPYVFHCHLVEHEDDGMMAQFEVVPATDANQYAHGDEYADAHAHAHPRRDEHPNEHAHPDEYANQHAHGDEHANQHAHRDEYANQHAHRDEYADQHAHRDEYANQHADAHEHTPRMNTPTPTGNDHANGDSNRDPVRRHEH